MTTRAVVIVVDRLGAGFLGPYGATWLDTPGFNALAAESLTLETVLADTPDLAEAYLSYWTGRHALCHQNGGLQGDYDHLSGNVARRLQDAGVKSVLLTDDDAVAEHPLAEHFSELIHLRSEPAQACALDVEQTQLATVFSSAMECLEKQQGDCLLWVHAQGMQAAWDAPLAFRQRLAAEDDPVPPDDVTPPSLTLAKDYDPDLLLGLVQSYAGQVQLLDACLAALWNDIRRGAEATDTLLLTTSPRGYPLGEHLIVGESEVKLYGELLHVPLFVWTSNGALAAVREPTLAQPADVTATLADWFSAPLEEAAITGRSLLRAANGASGRWPHDRSVCVSGDQRGIRTPAWYLREEKSPDGSQSPAVELFRKPDDRWEINEVAQLCTDIVDQLSQAMDDLEQAFRVGTLDSLPPLAKELIEGIE